MAHPNRPYGKKAPPGSYDTIVVGSGMGGMTCAALLSLAGERVLVLEQHYVPGGFTHSFHRKGWSWDVGVHAIGEVTEHSYTGRLLSKLTFGRLSWASLGKTYDEFTFPGDFRISFPDTPEAFVANLKTAFPNEGRAIDNYLTQVREVAKAMRGYYGARLLPGAFSGIGERLLAPKARKAFLTRTGEVLAKITQDPRLRTVLCAQWGYYGSPPSRSSFAIQALVARHFLFGGYYPKGGASSIANELLRTVSDAGGWTRIRADVAEILLEDSRAVGVRLVDGEVIRAGKRVISAVGIRATCERLLPRALAQSMLGPVLSLSPAPAHVCLYLGFKGDIRKAGATAANQWFYETWDPESEVWDIETSKEGPQMAAPVLYCSFPSLKDPEHDPGPEVLHTGEVVTFVPWQVFERWKAQRWRRRDEDYQALKERLSAMLLKQLLSHMPNLAPYIAYSELSTPLSTDHFARPIEGSIYGLEPTPERFACTSLRPKSPVPGLYFAGSEVATVGVMGAMMGGVMAALAASPTKVLPLLIAAGRS